MGQILKITTDNKVTKLEYPKLKGLDLVHWLSQQISGCECIEGVRPLRLYSDMMISPAPTKQLGSSVAMVIDEDGYAHEQDVNIIGSWLYKTDYHGSPILGDILIVGEYINDEGIDFCELSDENMDKLYRRINVFVDSIQELKKGMSMQEVWSTLVKRYSEVQRNEG